MIPELICVKYKLEEKCTIFMACDIVWTNTPPNVDGTNLRIKYKEGNSISCHV